MPTMMDLLQKVLDERRAQAESTSRLQSADVARQNATTYGETARFDLDTKKRSMQAEIELAHRLYPDLDPVEALYRKQADDMAEDRDIKRQTAQSGIDYRQILEADRQSQMRNREVDNDRAQLAEERRMQDSMLGREKDALLIENLRKYGRTQAPAPQRGGGTPKPLKVDPKASGRAEVQLAEELGRKPTPEEIYARAVLNQYGVKQSGAQSGGETVADEAACKAQKGIMKNGICYIP